MDILFDEDDRMWVERRSDGRWRVYDVYDADGQLIGELTTPVSSRSRFGPYTARPPGREPRFAGRDDRASAR